MPVVADVDPGRIELVEGAGHRARARRAADSRGKHYAGRVERRARRFWRSTIWAPGWPFSGWRSPRSEHPSQLSRGRDIMAFARDITRT